MDTEYPVNVSVTLEPVGQPWIKIQVLEHTVTQCLTHSKKFVFDVLAPRGQCLIAVEHIDKQPDDPDTAVIVRSVEFFGICDPKFVWNGVYRPRYPEPWFSQQNPSPADSLPGANYLGWNGQWSLRFDVPVFSWMHQTLNLGWLYQ